MVYFKVYYRGIHYVLRSPIRFSQKARGSFEAGTRYNAPAHIQGDFIWY